MMVLLMSVWLAGYDGKWDDWSYGSYRAYATYIHFDLTTPPHVLREPLVVDSVPSAPYPWRWHITWPLGGGVGRGRYIAVSSSDVAGAQTVAWRALCRLISLSCRSPLSNAAILGSLCQF
jgi:hypothetical protein